MAKFHTPKLAPNGRYRVIVGDRSFWLGKDHQKAIDLTRTLEITWANEKSTDSRGKKCWSGKSIHTAFHLAGITPPKAAPAPHAVPMPSVVQHHPHSPAPTFRPAFQPREISFHQALDLYVQMRLKLQTVRRAGEDSESYINSIKPHLVDMPLHSIDAAIQTTIADKIISRPPNKRTGEPISIVTARKWLQELGAAFEYFSHPDSRIGWVPPYLQWREKFSITDTEAKNIAIKTGDRDYGKVPPTYTLDQLALIYKLATPLDRMYILGGVCLGWTAMEFATLQRDQIKEADGEMYITKERSKTGVEMTFWVCPELATLLKDAINRTPVNDGDLALMTQNRRGKPFPLVHGKTDTISQSWERLMYRINKHEQRVPDYGHSCLRKLAGQLVENITGNHGLAQLLLAHKKADVASTNYIGIGVNVGVGKSPLQRVWEAQREVHKALAPVLASTLKLATKKVKPQTLVAA